MGFAAVTSATSHRRIARGREFARAIANVITEWGLTATSLGRFDQSNINVGQKET
jgi:hypothetical protein